MPAYKDQARNTWYCQFYYRTWDGQQKKKIKRGFATKREALQWETEFKNASNASMDMTMNSFVDVYFNDKIGELKERSIRNKRYMINVHVLPYFGDMKMNEIRPKDIIHWQQEIQQKSYSLTYLRMIQNQVTALFTHACKIYDLKDNPCKKVKKMGKSDADELNFWKKEEYERFIGTFDKKDKYYVLFELLFWTGCRIGEVLALAKSDIDFANNKIYINKTYYRVNREDVITSPKTENSIRTIEISEFLKVELQEYVNRLYDWPDDKRIFCIVGEAVQRILKRHIKKAGVKDIRVHDFRHSHVAFLIHQSVQPLLIQKRLGHGSISITLGTYGHLYDDEQKKVAEMLNEQK